MPAQKPSTQKIRSPLGSDERRIRVEGIIDEGREAGWHTSLTTIRLANRASAGQQETVDALTLVMRGTPQRYAIRMKLVWGRAHSPVPRSAATRLSPHVAALAFRANHGSIGFAGPRLLKLREIGKRADDAVLCDGMGIALHHQALRVGTDLVAAELSPGDEELLLGSEAVDVSRARFAFERFLIGEVGNFGAAQISDAFAENE